MPNTHERAAAGDTTTTAAPSGAAYAFVTLVTTDQYLPAALVAAHSLRLAHAQSSHLSEQDNLALRTHDDAQNTSMPQLGPWHRDGHSASSRSQRSNTHLVALVTPVTLSVQTIRVLLKVFDRVIGVEPLTTQSILAMQQLGQVKTDSKDLALEDIARRNDDNLALLGRVDLGASGGAALTKLHAWRLTEYQKVVYLDADTLVLSPLAHLFCSPHSFAAAPDTGWPDIFNSGVMLLTPSEQTFMGLIELGASTGSWDGADQGLINEYFGGEIGSGSEGQGGGWARLGFVYNTTALGGYTYSPAFRRFGTTVKVAHFIGENKPWRNRSAVHSSSAHSRLSSTGSSDSDSQSMATRWWNVYNSYYPSAPEDSSNDNDSDLEVKITENGVEIVERPKVQFFNVPTLQTAWDSVGSSSVTTRRGATVDELKTMFHQDMGSKIETGRDSEGRYESLPLLGRVDLLAPVFDFVAAVRVTTPPTPTQQPLDVDVAPWDATTGPGPSIEGSSSPQMRNLIDTFYPNAWDQAVDPEAEAQRRREFSNMNARAEAEGRWGYIPPEAKEIHTYDHLGGGKPDELKVKAIFPWEERGQKGERRSPPPAPKASLLQAHHDPSLGRGSRAQATRRFDNYVVPSSLSGIVPGDGASGSLVSRYGNVWDSQSLLTSPHYVMQSAEAVEAGERHIPSSTSVSGSSASSTSRRRQKAQESSTGTRSRPTSHYVPNNYDQYAPPPPHHVQGGLLMNPSALSDCSIDDSIDAEHHYPQPLGGDGGAGTGARGFGEVEGSGSWATSPIDLIRPGKGAGFSSVERSAATGQRGGRRSRQGGGMGQSRYGMEADDGDDESSTEEMESLQSKARRSRQSTYGELSPPIGTSSVISSTPPPSSIGTDTLSPSLSSSTAGGEDRFPLMSSSGTDSGGGGATSSPSTATVASRSGVPTPQAYAREGPGYNRKSQQTDFARANITPRASRTAGSGSSLSNIALPPTSSSSYDSNFNPSGVDQAFLARATTEGTSTSSVSRAAALTGRARIRPEKMEGGRGEAERGVLP